jgi:Mg2+ and Co2+ transporter CorA
VFELTGRMHRPSGLPPGTLVHVGEKKLEKVRITVMDFDGESIRERVVDGVEECFQYRDKPTTTWINVDGVHDVGIVEKLGACYGIHPIVLEDIVNTVQRPKMLDFGDYIFISLKMLYFGEDKDRVKVEQVSLVLGANFVISSARARERYGGQGRITSRIPSSIRSSTATSASSSGSASGSKRCRNGSSSSRPPGTSSRSTISRAR